MDGEREVAAVPPGLETADQPDAVPFKESVSSEPGHPLANFEMRDVSPPASAQYGGSKHWIWSSRRDPELLGD